MSDALLTKATLPLTPPPAAGANVTLKVAVCPTDKVRGSEGPVMLNPAPETVAWEIVTVPLPDSVTAWVVLLPTKTLPKLMPAGTALSTGTAETAPVPDRLILAGVFSALLDNTTLPLTGPAAAGVNVTLKVAVCPTVKLAGTGPLMLNPAPDTVG